MRAVLALVLSWLVLVVGLLAGRPPGKMLAESLHLAPDRVRCACSAGTDKTQPAGVRVRLARLLAYWRCPSIWCATSSQSSVTPTTRSSPSGSSAGWSDAAASTLCSGTGRHQEKGSLLCADWPASPCSPTF